MKEIEKLTEKLEPREQRTSRPRSVSSCKPAPDSIKAILEAGLTEAGAGKEDWSHFSTNLGFDCEEKQKIRLRQGEGREELEVGDSEVLLQVTWIGWRDRTLMILGSS